MYRPHPILAPALFIPGVLYEALIRFRNGLYDADLLRQRRLAYPAISIGNVTMGGTGKTPLAIHLCRTLIKLGFAPAILSRGYGRNFSKESYTLSPGETISSPSAILGDEPALMRRHLPDLWMGISNNRFAAAAKISQPRTVFVLDDGFQHRKLIRDLDIVVLDRSQSILSDHVFPRGTLREPLSGLRRSHVIVINGSPTAESPDSVETAIRIIHPSAAVFHCEQKIESFIPFNRWKEQEQCGHGGEQPGSAYLVAALGNPQRFQRDVLQLGIEVRGCRFYRDHFALSPDDWRVCAEEARQLSVDAIITTEKDAVKTNHPPDFSLLVSVQSTRIIEAEEFEHLLKQTVEGKP